MNTISYMLFIYGSMKNNKDTLKNHLSQTTRKGTSNKLSVTIEHAQPTSTSKHTHTKKKNRHLMSSFDPPL